MTVQKVKKVNIREVARVAGTSVASVSRALRDTPSPNLSAAQRAHILKVCEKLQYYPNEHTRRMFSKRSNTIALYFPSFGPMEDFYESNIIDVNFGACMQGIHKTLTDHSMQLLLSEASDAFLATKEHLKMIRGKMVDGIIIWGVTAYDNYVHELMKENIPLVMVQNEKADCNCTKVIADDYGGMLAMIDQIAAAGHRNISVTRATTTSSAGAERMRGIIDGLARHQLEPVYITEQSGFGHRFGLAAAEEILTKRPDTTCIIASNDMAAWGCIEYARSRDLNVPDDISIAGADGLKFPGEMVVSSYFSPSFELGKLGAEYLLKLINGEKVVERVCLPTTPIFGNTIGKKHG